LEKVDTSKFGDKNTIEAVEKIIAAKNGKDLNAN